MKSSPTERGTLPLSTLAQLHHELQTPLANLSQLIGLVLERPDQLTPQHQNWLRLALETTCSLRDMVHQHLLQTDHKAPLPVQREWVNLLALLLEVEAVYRAKAGLQQHPLTFALTLNEAVPNLVWSHRGWLLQILHNLLGNAFKYGIEMGGTIGLEVCLSSVLPGNVAAPEALLFRVTDTGPGIPLDQQQTLFAQHNLASVSSSPTVGHGMGLVIAQQLASAMGGHITVCSQPGQGTAFTVQLPVVLPNNQPAAQGPTAGLHDTPPITHALLLTDAEGVLPPPVQTVVQRLGVPVRLEDRALLPQVELTQTTLPILLATDLNDETLGSYLSHLALAPCPHPVVIMGSSSLRLSAAVRDALLRWSPLQWVYVSGPQDVQALVTRLVLSGHLSGMDSSSLVPPSSQRIVNASSVELPAERQSVACSAASEVQQGDDNRLLLITPTACECISSVLSAVRQRGIAAELWPCDEATLLPPVNELVAQQPGALLLCHQSPSAALQAWLGDPAWQGFRGTVLWLHSPVSPPGSDEELPSPVLPSVSPQQQRVLFGMASFQHWLDAWSLKRYLQHNSLFVYLTPDDCECLCPMAEEANQLGVDLELVTYPALPPAPEELVALLEPQLHQASGRRRATVALCTKNLDSEFVDQWLHHPIWRQQAAEGHVEAVLLYDQAAPGDVTSTATRQAFPFAALRFASPDQLATAYRVILNRRWHETSTPQLQVLLVEDNLMSRLVMSELLAGCPTLGVHVVASGQEALEWLHNLSASVPLLVLTDLRLGDGQAVDWLTQWQAACPPQTVYVGLSAYADTQELAMASEKGLSLCLNKPVSRAVLAKTLADLFPFLDHPFFKATPQSPPLASGSSLPSVAVNTVITPHPDEDDTKLAGALPPESPPMNLDNFRLMLQERHALMQQMMDLFLQDVPPLLAELRRAVEARQYDRLEHEAHQLKGTCAYMHAEPMQAAAYALERMARQAVRSAVGRSLFPQQEALALLEQLNQQFAACQRYWQSYWQLPPTSSWDGGLRPACGGDVLGLNDDDLGRSRTAVS